MPVRRERETEVSVGERGEGGRVVVMMTIEEEGETYLRRSLREAGIKNGWVGTTKRRRWWRRT